MYRPLGSGDVDVPAIVGSLHGRGYDGWYVLEQDTILTEEPAGEGLVADVGQRRAPPRRAGPHRVGGGHGAAAHRRPRRRPDLRAGHRRPCPHHRRLLVAVAARDRSRAEAFAATHGVERVAGSYAEVLADPEVEVVYNPLANSLHGPWNLAAVAAGRHVLTEKPSASNATELPRSATPPPRPG